MAHRHRSGSLKQSNKSHKTNKSSKRSLNKSAGGKLQGKASTKTKSNNALNISKAKANRANMAKQKREASKDKLLQLRRAQGRCNINGNANGNQSVNISQNIHTVNVPRIIGFISLSNNEAILESAVSSFLLEAADQTNSDSSSNLGATTTALYSKYKKEGLLTFLNNTTAFYAHYLQHTNDLNPQDASVQAALDLSRVCDTIIFLIDGSCAKKTNDHDEITGMSIGENSNATHTNHDYDHLISTRGDRILSALKAQGLPTTLTVLVNVENEIHGGADDDVMSFASYQSMKSIRRSALKQRLDLKKYVSRFATTEFGEAAKVMELDIPSLQNDFNTAITTENHDQDINAMTTPFSNQTVTTETTLLQDTFPSRASLIRALCTMSASPPKWVANMPRPFILSDGNGVNNRGYLYDTQTQQLKINGYIRGRCPWNVNSLAHIPHIGTFGVKQIERCSNKILSSRRNTKKTKNDTETNCVSLLGSCDASKRESLCMFADPDALEGEQNLVGFEDDEDDYDNDDDDNMENDHKDGEFHKGIARPTGWSDYQSAWLDAIKDDEDDDDDSLDHGELAFELNKKSSASVATGLNMDEEDANFINEQERKALLEERRKNHKDDLEFPDEVEVKEDENARDRFARYRSLKSFRKSYWDPKENLPQTYGSIYHFSSFKATQADVMADMKEVMDAATTWSTKISSDSDELMKDEEEMEYDPLENCIPFGSYVSITIENVPPVAFNRISQEGLISVVSLLPHENKVSVLHMALSQTTQCDTKPNDAPVKSKDILTFRCGWRTWQSRPVFSQNNLNSDKHKFERYLPKDGAFFAASIFGPVTYTPCPVLVYRVDDTGGMELVAHGSMLGADADRIVVKRIILTGYPTRVHKRNATVKYMFYNPDDVKWFKPAGLTTKHGLQGNIIQSVGDHGTMKCLFNAPVKQHDTVCLPLYKRIFPKYATSESMDEKGCVTKHELIVL
jgi:pre-rRNA-processing protein TSR1